MLPQGTTFHQSRSNSQSSAEPEELSVLQTHRRLILENNEEFSRGFQEISDALLGAISDLERLWTDEDSSIEASLSIPYSNSQITHRRSSALLPNHFLESSPASPSLLDPLQPSRPRNGSDIEPQVSITNSTCIRQIPMICSNESETASALMAFSPEPCQMEREDESQQMRRNIPPCMPSASQSYTQSPIVTATENLATIAAPSSMFQSSTNYQLIHAKVGPVPRVPLQTTSVMNVVSSPRIRRGELRRKAHWNSRAVLGTENGTPQRLLPPTIEPPHPPTPRPCSQTIDFATTPRPVDLQTTQSIPVINILPTSGVDVGVAVDVERPVGTFAVSSPVSDIYSPDFLSVIENDSSPRLECPGLNMSNLRALSSLAENIPADRADDTVLLLRDSANPRGYAISGVVSNGRLRDSIDSWMNNMERRDPLLQEAETQWLGFLQFLQATRPSLAKRLFFVGIVYYMRRLALAPHQNDNMLPGDNISADCHICKYTQLFSYGSDQVTYNPESPENDCCSICLEKFLRYAITRRLSCRHVFHALCIEPWLNQNDACPACRKSVRDTSHNITPEMPES